MAHVLNIITEAEKNLLIDRYLDLEFIDDITDFQCVRCDRVAISHYFSDCGHVYCKSCRNIHMVNKWSCPKCQTPVTRIADQKVGVQLRIYGLRTHCPNKKYGCNEVATLVEIPSHLKRCKKTKEENSTSKLKADKQMKDIIQRLDTVTASINSNRENQKRLEDTLNKALETINKDRAQIQSRLDEMDKRFNVKKTFIPVANNNGEGPIQNEVLLELKNDFRTIRNEQDIINTQLQKLEVRMKFWSETNFTWDINTKDGAGFSFISNDDMVSVRRLSSPYFTISGHSVEAQAILMGSGYIYLIFSSSQTDKRPLQLNNPLPRITYSVFSSGTDNNITRQCPKDAYTVVQNIGFIHQLRTEHSDYKTPTVHLIQDVKSFATGDPFTVKVTVDFPHLYERPFSTDGILQWQIHDFNNKSGLIYSPYFYTSPQGYRVNVGLTFNEGLMAWINFLTGEFDRLLPPTTQFMTTVTLKDQSPLAAHGDVVRSTTLSTSLQLAEGISLWPQSP